MTTGTTPPSTSVSPTARQVWTRARGVVLAAVVLLAAAAVIAVIRSGAEHGRLDPRSADTDGSRAVAELLDDRGVSTRLVTTLDEARAAVGPDTTLLVAVPDLLTDSQQRSLREATEASGGRTVLVAPGPPSVHTLAPGVTADAALSLDSTLRPRCELPAARRAGSADTGGLRYHVTARAADACYPEDGLPTLVRLPAAEGDGDTVVLGAPDILLNSSLDEQGNASLALQLLGSRPHVVWYLPSLSDDSAPDAGNRSFFDLLPRAGSGAPCNSSSPEPSPPSGGHADWAPWCPRNSPSRSAPPRPSKAAPASTARPTPAIARPPLFAPPPARASPPS